MMAANANIIKDLSKETVERVISNTTQVLNVIGKPKNITWYFPIGKLINFSGSTKQCLNWESRISLRKSKQIPLLNIEEGFFRKMIRVKKSDNPIPIIVYSEYDPEIDQRHKQPTKGHSEDLNLEKKDNYTLSMDKELSSPIELQT
ncbi:unnamed protein product [Lepeophtheirus salmonis]|uniref:(salmon louse) hypothetical protein n=1 Tax=Lepeophtheirus salmonis TaxID=72036 RepID=A0A7R8CYP9_LEPSM|nr:unnamed protein product [Lepeophtheirus salmonis]CAF2970209.1 unnamed protein product [Lepeophtheirus salmonis]